MKATLILATLLTFAASTKAGTHVVNHDSDSDIAHRTAPKGAPPRNPGPPVRPHSH